MCSLCDCLTSDLALQATLPYERPCLTSDLALRATLPYEQPCLTSDLALRATLPYERPCLMSDLALQVTLLRDDTGKWLVGAELAAVLVGEVVAMHWY